MGIFTEAMGGGYKMPKGRTRHAPLRGVRHGGHTGHATRYPGPHASYPHDGHHTGRNHGMGHFGGPHAATPHSGKVARSTGYKGTHGDYAAAGPHQGFVTSGRGHFTPQQPAGY